MDWLEVTVKLPSKEIEKMADQLEDLGVSGVVIEDEADFKRVLAETRQYWDYVDEALYTSMAGKSQIKFYLRSGEKERLEKIKHALSKEITVRRIREEDWAVTWKQYYRPIEIGRKLLVLPRWMEAPETDRCILRLDPGLLFGIGDHPTTKMCLAAVEHRVKPGARVLDLGCGSGILGIGALLLGAKTCLGCDIDKMAPRVAAENAGLNGIGDDKYTALAGDVLEEGALKRAVGTGCFDMVLANIVADVIIPLGEAVRAWLAPDGVFICSGILHGREAAVREALQRNGLHIAGALQMGDWYSYVCENFN